MHHTTTAIWRADRLDDATGEEFPYSFTTGFEAACETHPEALLAAAHAACFSRSLITELEALGIRPPEIQTTATVSWNGVHLAISGTVDKNVQAAGFHRAAVSAIKNCPIPQQFKAKITLSVEMPIAGHKSA